MSMWPTDDGTKSNLSDAERSKEETRLRKQLDQLEQDLELALKGCIASVKVILADNIYYNLDRYVPMAEDEAVKTATGWALHRSLGGLLWSTYKATCRRNGVYAGAAGHRDFNAELFDPVSKHLARGWERAFQRRLPSSLDGFERSVWRHLETFHGAATQRAKECGTDYNGINMLNQQLQAHAQQISDTRSSALASAQELQREANRSFTPVIQQDMVPAYRGCVEERGTGSFMRMKNIMQTHVAARRGTMFWNATNAVKQQLEAMCDAMRAQMEDRIRDMHARLSRDYLAVLVGADAVARALGPPRAELMLRAEMAPLLAKADLAFAELFSFDMDKDPRGGGDVAGEECRGGEVVENGPDLDAQSEVRIKAEGN
ncbi:hypothetical protein VTK56DRAFT_5080 [Thermocarpiscus australiensis]